MSSRFLPVLLLVVLSGLASPARSEEEPAPADRASTGQVPENLSGYSQVIEDGRIEWSELRASAWGKTLKVVLNPGGLVWKAQARAEASRDAVHKLYPVLSELPVRADARLEDRPEWLTGMRHFLPTLRGSEERATRNNFFEVRLDVPLYGPDGLASAIRPRDEPAAEPPPGSGIRPAGAVEGPTALVMDARGTGALPVLWPRILDEDGKVLLDYGPGPEAPASPLAAVGYYWAPPSSRTRASSTGDFEGYRSLMGSRPLVVKPIRAQGERPGDFVLSRADAAALAGQKRAMDLARVEGLFVILDPPPPRAGQAIKKPLGKPPLRPRPKKAGSKIPQDGS